jgi:surfeit locus 1 family protein
MRWRSVLVGLVVLTIAATCVRLGFWQLSRWHEKQALNAATLAALTEPPVVLGAEWPSADALAGRRVEVRGRFDASRQVLLVNRVHAGAPGVHAVTPLRTGGGRVVLVDRGWLFAADGSNATPRLGADTSERVVIGIAEAVARRGKSPAWRARSTDSLALWTAVRLDPDSLAARFPYALASIVIRELPGPGVPDEPRRSMPAALDTTMHLSYAVQWFLFATILLGGSLLLSVRRRREAATHS